MNIDRLADILTGFLILIAAGFATGMSIGARGCLWRGHEQHFRHRYPRDIVS